MPTVDAASEAGLTVMTGHTRKDPGREPEQVGKLTLVATMLKLLCKPARVADVVVSWPEPLILRPAGTVPVSDHVNAPLIPLAVAPVVCVLVLPNTGWKTDPAVTVMAGHTGVTV